MLRIYIHYPLMKRLGMIYYIIGYLKVIGTSAILMVSSSVGSLNVRDVMVIWFHYVFKLVEYITLP